MGRRRRGVLEMEREESEGDEWKFDGEEEDRDFTKEWRKRLQQLRFGCFGFCSTSAFVWGIYS